MAIDGPGGPKPRGRIKEDASSIDIRNLPLLTRRHKTCPVRIREWRKDEKGD